jgi:hypothetical protein
MKRLSLLRIGALTAVLVSLAPPPTIADEHDKKGIVNFSQPTEVPGIVLPPGTYVIKLLDSQSNRHIAEIMNEKMDHLYALTFTAAAFRVERTGKPVLTFYEGTRGQPPAIRRWFWPGELDGIEFLYPKDQAAKIAAATNQRVAEGGLPTVAESGQSLTPDNSKGFTLHSQDESKPATTPLTAAAAEPAAAPPPVVIAQNAPPPQPARETVQAQPAQAAQSNSPAVSADANSSDRTSDTNLPQTASNLPLIGAIGIVSLLMAFLIASVRRYHSL